MGYHAIIPHDRRRWWPEDYLDDEMPEGRATPSEWIYRLHDGSWSCGDPDDDMAPSFPLWEGRTVQFVARDRLGHSICIIGPAGTDTWSPEPPEGATLWAEHEFLDALGDGTRDFSEILRSYNSPVPGERIVVNVARWHDKGLALRFTAENGPPRFVAYDPIPEVGPALPEIAREDGPDLFASPVA